MHSPNTFVYNLAKGERNEFRWTIENGEDEGKCITSSSIAVITQNEVKRYQGISPNGDGMKEYFIIQGLQEASSFSIQFFNALGRPWRDLGFTELVGIEPNLAFKKIPLDDPLQRQPDISLAKEHLDWEPRTQLQEGLEQSIPYFRTLLA